MTTLKTIQQKHSTRGYTDDVLIDIRNRLNVGMKSVDIIKLYENTQHSISRNVIQHIKNGKIKTLNELITEHTIESIHANEENIIICSTCNNKIPKDRLEINQLTGENYVTGETAKYTREYREKQREKLGDDEYLRRNTDTHRKWVTENKEHINNYHDMWKKSINYRYNEIYKRSTRHCIPITLTLEQLQERLECSCFYCGREKSKSERHFGLDRFNNEKGYVEGNMVTCCTTCNMMKKDIPYHLFMRQIEHILSYNERIIEGRSCGDFFPNCKNIRNITYDKYKRSAKLRGKSFEITQDHFDKITSKPCYICGKRITYFHKNGIDRLYNTVGYVYENCMPCCKTCNYYKKDMSLEDMFTVMHNIYTHMYQHISQINNEDLNLIQCVFDINDLMSNTTSSEDESVSMEEEVEIKKHTDNPEIHVIPTIPFVIDKPSEQIQQINIHEVQLPVHSTLQQLVNKHGDIITETHLKKLTDDFLVNKPKILKSNASLLYTEMKKFTYQNSYLETAELTNAQHEFLVKRYTELYKLEMTTPSAEAMRKFKAQIRKINNIEATEEEIDQYMEEYRQKRKRQANPELKLEREKKLNAKRQTKYRNKK